MGPVPHREPVPPLWGPNTQAFRSVVDDEDIVDTTNEYLDRLAVGLDSRVLIPDPHMSGIFCQVNPRPVHGASSIKPGTT